MIKINIQKELFKYQDLEYREFNRKLVQKVEVIGVRIPILRRIAKNIKKDNEDNIQEFLRNLPHDYLEENHLHAFILEEEKNLKILLEEMDFFLPYIDNWQTCDSFLPKILKKENKILPSYIEKWILSDKEFIRRYAIRLKLSRKDFEEDDIISVIKAGKSEMYYVYMGAAWYLSMAAKYNRKIFLKHLDVEKMGEKLYVATLRKILESQQFSKIEKEKYKKNKSWY